MEFQIIVLAWVAEQEVFILQVLISLNNTRLTIKYWTKEVAFMIAYSGKNVRIQFDCDCVASVLVLQIWVRKTSDSTKMRIYLGQLQRGAFVIRRRSAAWNITPPLPAQHPSDPIINPSIHLLVYPLFLDSVHASWVWRVACYSSIMHYP